MHTLQSWSSSFGFLWIHAHMMIREWEAQNTTALKEYQLKAPFCFQSNSSIRVDHAAQTRRKYCISLIHLQSLIELKALQRCTLVICMLKQKSQKQNIKSSSHGSAVVSEEGFLDIYLILREEKRTSRGREAEVERTVGLYVLHWGRWTSRQDRAQLELQHGPYGCYSLDPLFSKTKYFFKWLWAHRPGTHTLPFSLLLYGMTGVCFLAQVLVQDI